MKRRSKFRIDDHPRHIQIAAARKWIYSRGGVITGKPMDRLLGIQSWVPTRVSPSTFDFKNILMLAKKERLFETRPMGIRHVQIPCPGPPPRIRTWHLEG